MSKLIYGGALVNEERVFQGSIAINNGKITEIIEGTQIPRGSYDETIDATGCFVIPGVIDTHVHFREPGLTEKADIKSESRAAAYGGVTSYLEMPNTVPQTTSLEALNDKFTRAKGDSYVNYSFFFGATNDNADLFSELDKHQVPGVKLFMGSSTGNMLVDRYGSLLKVFEKAAQAGFLVMAHCEDSDAINRNMEQMRKTYGDFDPPVMLHPMIRSEEACFESSALAAQLARTYNTRLHIAHLSTAKELDLLGGNVTGEACVAHLYFTHEDYITKGALIKCNPAIKKPEDRQALRQALSDGRITTIATDHAPHLLSQKQGGCVKAASGMPMVQFSLVTMLELVDDGILSLERLVTLMAHNPASLFGIRQRGFLRRGYQADVAIVRPHSPWTLTDDIIQSKCGWSPMAGHEFQWRVEHTFCNGRHLLNKGVFDDSVRGEALAF